MFTERLMLVIPIQWRKEPLVQLVDLHDVEPEREDSAPHTIGSSFVRGGMNGQLRIETFTELFLARLADFDPLNKGLADKRKRLCSCPRPSVSVLCSTFVRSQTRSVSEA